MKKLILFTLAALICMPAAGTRTANAETPYTPTKSIQMNVTSLDSVTEDGYHGTVDFQITTNWDAHDVILGVSATFNNVLVYRSIDATKIDSAGRQWKVSWDTTKDADAYYAVTIQADGMINQRVDGPEWVARVNNGEQVPEEPSKSIQMNVTSLDSVTEEGYRGTVDFQITTNWDAHDVILGVSATFNNILVYRSMNATKVDADGRKWQVSWDTTKDADAYYSVTIQADGMINQRVDGPEWVARVSNAAAAEAKKSVEEETVMTPLYVPEVVRESTPSISEDKALRERAPIAVPRCTAGARIRGSQAAVYYCGDDGRRYTFPNERVYFSWYQDFNGIEQLPDETLAQIPLGGNTTYRPGTRMIKIVSDPRVYAVSRGGVLRHIPSEAVARQLYGDRWQQQIDDVSDAFFVNYTVGDPIELSL